MNAVEAAQSSNILDPMQPISPTVRTSFTIVITVPSFPLLCNLSRMGGVKTFRLLPLPVNDAMKAVSYPSFIQSQINSNRKKDL